jgi:hypothetical protein
MEEKFITCPYCLQKISILLDIGIEGQSNIIDDCEVCCRPIDITYSVEDREVIALYYTSIEGNEF